jgi:hypothetical protein
MARIQTEVISVRLTPKMMELVLSFARRNQMLNPDGSPNVGAAGRALLALGLDQGNAGAAVFMAAYDSARSKILQHVQGKLKAVMTALTREIGEGKL